MLQCIICEDWFHTHVCHITSHHITSHHITSHHITQHAGLPVNIPEFDEFACSRCVSCTHYHYYATSCHITSHHITSHIASHHITSHHITSHTAVLHAILSFDTTLWHHKPRMHPYDHNFRYITSLYKHMLLQTVDVSHSDVVNGDQATSHSHTHVTSLASDTLQTTPVTSHTHAASHQPTVDTASAHATAERPQANACIKPASIASARTYFYAHRP